MRESPNPAIISLTARGRKASHVVGQGWSLGTQRQRERQIMASHQSSKTVDCFPKYSKDYFDVGPPRPLFIIGHQSPSKIGQSRYLFSLLSNRVKMLGFVFIMVENCLTAHVYVTYIGTFENGQSSQMQSQAEDDFYFGPWKTRTRETILSAEALWKGTATTESAILFLQILETDGCCFFSSKNVSTFLLVSS